METLFDIPFVELMTRPTTWHEGLPRRDGLARFAHVIRSPHDPDRLTRKEQRQLGKGFEAWRDDMMGDPRTWAAAIVRLLRDGQSRTFNRIVLDLTGRLYTADTAAHKAPDEGMWLAVERGHIWWAELEDGAMWFALRPRPQINRRWLEGVVGKVLKEESDV